MYIYHKNEQIIIISKTRLNAVGLDELEVDLGRADLKEVMRNHKVQDGKLVCKSREIDCTTKLKVAIVGVWDIPCGIATYTKSLVEEFKLLNHEVKVFTEYAGGRLDTSDVVHCWNRGESLKGLFRKIQDFAPDVIFIQHEYGIFPDARHWSKLISLLQDYNYYVVFHSVYNHKDKAVCEAICKNIIVHTEAAKQVLQDKGITANIQVIPHGCLELEETRRLWNIYRSPHTIVQFGFGFAYKGWDVALDAVQILKEKYPDVFYLILFSESPFVKEFHDIEYQKIVRLVEEKGLEDNVAVIRGFQSDQSLNNFLRTARVAVFPYTAHPNHVVYGSSGAVRLAISNNTPVVVSTVPLFYDLEGVVPRAANAVELAVEVDKLFSDFKYYLSVIKKERRFIKENRWDKIALKYLAAVCRPEKSGQKRKSPKYFRLFFGRR